MMYGPTALLRGQRAATRGLQALGKRVPAWSDPAYDRRRDDFQALYSPQRQAARRAERERQERARLEVLDAGRTLIAEALELERKADVARRAGVEALRHAWPSQSWEAIGELLGVSGSATHKRYRDVEGPEAQTTIDDELAAAR